MAITTTQELLIFHDRMCQMARDLMSRKNADYGAEGDPFANFHSWGLIGMVVRLDDKLARLRTFAKKGELQVKDETVTDTLIDIINYCVLIQGYINREEKRHGLASESSEHHHENSSNRDWAGPGAEIRAAAERARSGAEDSK